MKPLRNVINEELRRAVRVLLKKHVKPDAAIAERAGCSVGFVRQVRAEIKAEKEEQQS
jgi:hypothetical protein